MKYRVTTNGVEFRVEGECTYRAGWFWDRYTVTEWSPVNCFGKFPMEDEYGNISDYDGIEYYESFADASAAIQKFTNPEPLITRDSEWRPVTKES